MTTEVSRHWWWRPGWQPGSRLNTFHCTFAAQPAVQELAALARERLAAFAWLDLVPGEWLHCTTQGVGFAGDVTKTDLSAIADVWGTAQVPEAVEWAPHVSVAYANADGPAAPVDAALAGIQPATAILPALDLIRLGRDRHVYVWESIESIPLGG